MNRITLVMLMGVLLVSGCGQGEQDGKVLNFYNWNDYIDENTIAQFEEETGIKVNYDNYDSNAVIETKLIAGSSGYDLVVPSQSYVVDFIAQGLIQKLDKSKLPNLSNVDPLLYEKISFFDPGNEYGVNWAWGTTAIGYNVDAVKKALPGVALDSWSVLFDPKNAEKLAECGIGFPDDIYDVYVNALFYIGKSDELTIENYAEAQKVLLAIRPYIRYFNTSKIINDLANGEICIAIIYNGDVLQAAERASEADNGNTIEYLLPKEGAAIWFDSLAIPADAENVDEAHAFINYILRPQVAANITNYVYYANGNIASKEFIDEEVLNNPAVYPSEQTLSTLVPTLKLTSEEDRRRLNDMWTEVKTTIE